MTSRPMSNIDKRALREAAEKALNARARLALMQSVFDDDGDDVKPEAQEDISICVSFNELTNPATVLALLDELEAKGQMIAELEAKLETADKLQDSSFRHGLQHGFSYGQTDDQAGFEQAIQAYGQQWKGE